MSGVTSIAGLPLHPGLLPPCSQSQSIVISFGNHFTLPFRLYWQRQIAELQTPLPAARAAHTGPAG